jgi:hypothetical protein
MIKTSSPGLDQRQGRLEQRLLAAGGDDDAAVGLDPHVVVVRQFGGDRLAQGGDAGDGDVVGLAGVHGVGRRLADVGGGDEVRVAAAEVDDVDPLRLQLPGLVGDGERGRGGEVADAGGEEVGWLALGLGRHGSSCGSPAVLPTPIRGGREPAGRVAAILARWSGRPIARAGLRPGDAGTQLGGVLAKLALPLEEC